MNSAELLAKKLLEIGAIKLSAENPFLWASGLKSPIYCDNRLSLSYPEIRTQIKELFVEKIKTIPDIDGIAAVATAGIAHGVLIADALNLPFIYVRSKAKGHGRNNIIEGDYTKMSKIVLIEDLVSTGGSSLAALMELRNMGLKAEWILSIFNYQLELSKTAFEYEKCKLYSLCNYKSLLDEAIKNQFIDKTQYKLLEEWNQAPDKWSAKYNETKI